MNVEPKANAESPQPILTLTYSVDQAAVWSFLRESRRQQLRGMSRIMLRVLLAVGFMYLVVTHPEFKDLGEVQLVVLGVVAAALALGFFRLVSLLGLKILLKRILATNSATGKFKAALFKDRFVASNESGIKLEMPFVQLRSAGHDKKYFYLMSRPFQGFVIPLEALEEGKMKTIVDAVDSWRQSIGAMTTAEYAAMTSGSGAGKETGKGMDFDAGNGDESDDAKEESAT